MIDALVTGRLIHCKKVDNFVVGRIVMEGDKPIEFSARRGALKSALLALPFGMPISVAGPMSSCIRYDKDGQPYVSNEILIAALLTAQPPQNLLTSILSTEKP